MKSKDSFSRVTMIVGMVITALFIYAAVIDLIRALREGEDFIIYLENTFLTFDSYKSPPALYWIYLIGYAIVWWKQLWGSIIIIIVGILGLIISHYGDVRFSYFLIFIIGLLNLLNWNDVRKTNMRIGGDIGKV